MMKKKILRFVNTFGFNSKPDFIIVGAQKAGTTGLFSILKQHTLLQGSIKKELNYFSNDNFYQNNNISRYHANFLPTYLSPKGVQSFEASPMYLYHPEVAKRLHDYNPKLKIIILLREPAKRALSSWNMYHYKFQNSGKTELQDKRTFQEATSEEMEQIQKNGLNKNIFKNKGYIEKGIYHSQIQRYFDLFSRDQIRIYENTEIINDFNNFQKEMQSFLGVPFEDIGFKSSNKALKKNEHDYTDEIKRLKEFYKPHNEVLYEMIGKNLGWN